MFPGDSHTRGHWAVAGHALLLAGVGLLFWGAGEPALRLESRFHDLLQRVSAPAPGDGVAIVTLDSPPGLSLWSSPQFSQVVEASARAGAAVLVPTESPGPGVRAGEVERLAALLALESQANAGETARLERLRQQLADLEARRSRQTLNAAAVARAGNVVISPRLVGRDPGAEGVDQACLGRLAAAAADDEPRASGQQLGRMNPVLCETAAALAHLDFPAEGDGVVRVLPGPMVLAEGLLPPAGGAAADLRRRLGSSGDLVEMPLAPRHRYLRFYSRGALAPAFPTLPAADVLAGRESASLRGQVVVIGNKTAPATLATPLGGRAPASVLLATSIANQLDGNYLVRPAWAPWLEAVLAALLGMALPFLAASLRLRVVALVAGGVTLGLLVAGAGFFLQGTWLHLASLAVFSVAGTALAGALARWSPRRASPPRPNRAGPVRDPGLAGPVAELDLAFSVLRQQPTTEETKARLYELAMEHGRRRDYARAERVFRHIASRDPGYRDVSAKLERLSGARLAAQPVERRQPAPAPQAAAGRSLGRYELERVLGRGAMATVYLGRDPTINRRVAIKTVPLAEEFEESDLANAKAHFRREAESSGRLNHPNIISIYDAGEDGNVAYLAMEYFEGQPLSHFTQMDQLLPPRVVLELMARAAEALHYAHSQNVVHRDVKPANILYHRASDTLKLTDFGIARLTDANRTRTGIILGTPSYMSPEQLTASKVTGRSDLYSLGVTMYHLLTGSPPFQADSIPRLMQRIAGEPHRPVREFRDDVPPCADAILDRALAKNPEDRFPDGRSMALALRECSDSVRTEFP